MEINQQTGPQIPPSQPIPQVKSSGYKIGMVIAIALVTLVLGGIGGYLLGIQQTKNMPSDQLSVNPSPLPVTSPTIEVTQPSPIVTVPSGSICTNTVLGVSLTIPPSWTCKIEELSGTEGVMTISSNLFTILISNLGRGPYCGEVSPSNTDDSCRTSSFLSNDKVNLTMYTSNGEDKEIWGGIVPLNRIEQNSKTWISIKYTNMEKQKLTESQKNDLLDVLNTIRITK